MKLALNHPQRYAAAASLSGVADIRGLLAAGEREQLFSRVFASEIADSEDPLRLLAQADPATLPRLWIGCGTEDLLFDGNRRFAEQARAAGAEVTTDFPPGDHEWSLWDAQLPGVLDFLLDIAP